MPKRALITGITGQDGSYLAEYLLAQGYEVWGLVRGQSNPRVRRVRRLLGEGRLGPGGPLGPGGLISAVGRVPPPAGFHLAAGFHPPVSAQQGHAAPA